MMKSFGAALLGASAFVSVCASTPAFAMAKKIPTATGSYCRDEAIEFVKGRFGEEARILSISPNFAGRTLTYWVRTNLCSGFFVMEFRNMDSSTCSMVQYFSRTRYMSRVWATDDCTRLIPYDVSG